MRHLLLVLLTLILWGGFAFAEEPTGPAKAEAAKVTADQRRAKMDEMRAEMRKLEDKQREEIRALRDKHLQEEKEIRERHKKAREELRAKYKT